MDGWMIAASCGKGILKMLFLFSLLSSLPFLLPPSFTGDILLYIIMYYWKRLGAKGEGGGRG